MWSIVKHFYWTGTNTNYRITEDMVTTPVDQDLHTPLRLNSDTVYRSFWWPRVDVTIPKSTSGLTPYWWLGSTVYLNVIWDVDSSFPFVPVNEGSNDPRIMGTVSLVPQTMVYDTGFDVTVVYAPGRGGLELEDRRKGAGADIIPTVHGQVWGFDHYGVFENLFVGHDVRYLSMISRVLWASDDPGP
jgi:hypothetical protein